MVGLGGMVHPAGIAFVLPAELALGIGGLGGVFSGSDGLGGDAVIAQTILRHNVECRLKSFPSLQSAARRRRCSHPSAADPGAGW